MTLQLVTNASSPRNVRFFVSFRFFFAVCQLKPSSFQVLKMAAATVNLFSFAVCTEKTSASS